MKKITLLIILVSCFLQAISQDYKADFEQAMTIFQEDVYEVEMEYILFPSHTATESTERETMSMKRAGNSFRMYQFGMDIICDNEHILMVNEKSQFIAIDRKREQSELSEADKKTAAALNAAVADLSKVMGLDTTSLKDTYDVEYLGVENGQKGYAFNYKYGEYEKIIAYIDTETKRMSRYVMYYRRPMEVQEDKFSKIRIEVNFLKQSNTPNFDKDTFNIRKYIDIQDGGKVTVSNKYNHFEIINHLETDEYN